MVTEDFDPYRQWLGIPLHEQPPHHYRLLGIGLYEDDPAVIEGAADRQMAHVNRHRTGKHSALTQELLNELSAAKLCLLDAEKRTAYDANLRQQLSPPKAPVPKAVVRPRAEPPAVSVDSSALSSPIATGETEPRAPEPDVLGTIGASSPRTTAYRRRPRRSNLPTVAIVAAAVAVCAMLGWLLSRSSTTTPQTAQKKTEAAHIKRSSDVVVRAKEPQPVQSTQHIDDSADSTPSQTATSHDAPDAAESKPTPVESPPTTEEPQPSVSTPSKAPAKPPETETPPAADPSASPPSFARRRSPFEAQSDYRAVVASIEEVDPRWAVVEAGDKPTIAVPSEQQQQAALKLVREVFADAYATASTAEDKIALAEKLYNQAARESSVPEERFALFSQACDHALAAGQVDVGLRIVDCLAQVFAIDRDQMRIDALRVSSEQNPTSATFAAISTHALAMMEPALMRCDFELTGRLFKIADAFATKSEDARLSRTTESIRDQIDRLEKEFLAFNDALAKLESDADDPSSNLTAGQYYCYTLGDWQTGLPYLVKCGQQELAGQATGDLKSPQTLDERLQVGDGWWMLAEAADEGVQEEIFARAAHWYRMILDDLPGLAKVKVQQRLEQLSSQQNTKNPPTAVTDSPEELPPFAKEFLGKYVLAQSSRKTPEASYSIWEFDSEGQISEDDKIVGKWEVADGHRIAVTMLESEEPPFFLKPRGRRSAFNASRKSQGTTVKLEFIPLTVVATWEHTTERPRFGRRERESTTETLTFYSNGRVNSPLGSNITWKLQGRNLAIDWGSSKTTIATIAPDGKTYTGKTSQPSGFGSFRLNLSVTGKLVEPSS